MKTNYTPPKDGWFKNALLVAMLILGAYTLISQIGLVATAGVILIVLGLKFDLGSLNISFKG